MKKTLIASAVAAATLSTSAMAMDQATALAERLDSLPTFYGNIQLVNNTVDDGTDDTSTFEDNGSTFGITHKHEITDGVTGFFKAEFEFLADDKGGSNGIDTLDEAYIGVEGDFGSLQIGSDDSVAEDFDMMDIEEVVGLYTGELVGMREGDNIQYRSPELAEGLSFGITQSLDLEPGQTVGTSVSATFEADIFTGVLSYAIGRDSGTVEGEDGIGIGLAAAIEDLTLMLQYESVDDASVIAAAANYSMGANNFHLGILSGTDIIDADNFYATEADLFEVYVQALHNVSDNMYVYVEYVTSTAEDAVGNADDIETDTFSIGAAYAF